MHKIAFFVEGQTEAIFTKKLIEEIAGQNNVYIETVNATRTFSFSKIVEPESGEEFFILIVNCSGDDAVKQKIKDNEKKLGESGYIKIIGLRDLYPEAKDNLQLVSDNLYVGLDEVIPIRIVVAVMEIEAWFIQETKHFTYLNPVLTPQKIREVTGFNPLIDDASDVNHPSSLLNSIYQVVGLSYTKKAFHVQMTTDYLDYEELYLNIRHKLNELDQYIGEIDNFITA